jgi:hypothetical protein
MSGIFAKSLAYFSFAKLVQENRRLESKGKLYAIATGLNAADPLEVDETHMMFENGSRMRTGAIGEGVSPTASAWRKTKRPAKQTAIAIRTFVQPALQGASQNCMRRFSLRFHDKNSGAPKLCASAGVAYSEFQRCHPLGLTFNAEVSRLAAQLAAQLAEVPAAQLPAQLPAQLAASLA